MSSKPQPDPDRSSDAIDRQPLPFEPTKSRKQAERKAERKATKPVNVTTVKQAGETKPVRTAQTTATGIPDAISRRMVKRMAVFCGIPTFLGMSTFIISYLVIIGDIYKVPTYAVLLVSLGFFGLGVLGLSYGALSASWDEATPGSRLGWLEFRTNWGRMMSGWKTAREETANKKS